MSLYERLLEQSTTTTTTTTDGDYDNTTNLRREIPENTPTLKSRVNATAETLLFTSDSSNDSSSTTNSTRAMHTGNTYNNNNRSSSRSSSNSLNSRSSASSSWEYSPFENASTNEINQTNINEMPTRIATTTTTTTAIGTKAIAAGATPATMNLIAASSKITSTSLLLDAYDVDDTTMEVPLLGSGNNNIDYHDHGNHHHQFSSATDDAIPAADTTCHCQLPGFNANLRTKSTQDAKFKILLAITLCCIFMIVEFLGGYMAGSLAIMTDAAHLASDCISFVIGLVAIWLGGRPPDNRMSFGYKRMEVMGAIISILGIWILTATLIMVAMERLYANDFDLNVNTMMIISGIGILINIVMAFILHGSPLAHHGHSHANAHSHGHSHSRSHTAANDNTFLQMNNSNGNNNELKHANKCSSHSDKEENLNLRAAMIHVIGDLVQSIGVFLASILIQIYPNAKFADPLCTLLFSVIVFMTTVRLFRESVGILLDAVPARISLDMLEMDLINIDGVKSVHHLNVWSHTNNYSIMMVHLVIDFLSDSNTVLQRATQIASSNKYDIKHCTIQIERLTS